MGKMTLGIIFFVLELEYQLGLIFENAILTVRGVMLGEHPRGLPHRPQGVVVILLAPCYLFRAEFNNRHSLLSQ